MTRWRRTGWLGRQDSNFRIKEACPIGPSAIVRRKEWQQMVCQSPSRWGARSASSTEASGTQIPRCRGSSPAAPASQSNLHRLTREHRSKRRGTPWVLWPLPQLRFAIRHFNVEIVRAFRACSHRRPAASARFENAERLVGSRLTEPADDHSDDACGHRQGRRPAESPIGHLQASPMA